jgi:hypothetical protein
MKNSLRRTASLVSSWLGRSGSPRRQPRRRAVAPGLEFLEDRIVPSALKQIDYGGLRFLASTQFQQSEITRDHYADSGYVTIGYTPAGKEKFQPLLQVDLTGGKDKTLLSLDDQSNPTKPEFELLNAVLDIAPVGGDVVLPIPIYKSGPMTIFSINSLIGPSGLTFSPTFGTVQPFEVGKVSFTPSTLYFANPNGPSTTDAQALLQGQVSFNNVPLLSGVTANVNNTNYVIADHTGLTITGATITKSFDFDSVTVDGSVTVGYDKPSNTWTFGGGVAVTTKPQDAGGNVALKSVQAGLDASVVNGQLNSFGFDVKGTFQIFDLTVSTVGSSGQPFTFQYNKDNQQYELSGGLELDFNDNEIIADFGTINTPGILIQDGQLTHLSTTLTGSFTLAGAKITSNGLTFQYDRAHDQVPAQFEMYGDLTLTVPTGETAQVLTVEMGSSSDPGLVIKDGQLSQINMGLSGSFDLYGLHVVIPTSNPLNVQWQSPDTFDISGTVTVDFQVFQMTTTLGSDGKPGLTISNGQFDVENVKFELDNATLGPVTLKKFEVAYAKDGNSFSVSGTVGLPGGYDVYGTLDIVNGRVHDVALGYTSYEGEPIGDTGLFLNELSGSVSNIDNPGSIVVTAHIGVTWGETFSLFGEEVKLFRATGDITADANELILSGSVQVGAWSPDNGVTWNDVAGEGDAKMTLDWGDHLYSLHVDVNGLWGFIDLSGDLTFNAGKEIKFLATADVVIPPQVPFIGGDKIAGIGFYFDHVFDQNGDNNATTTLAAWVDVDVIWNFEVGFELVYDANHPKGDFSLIGANTINNFQREAAHPVNQTYTYSADLGVLIPAQATSATLSADWSQPAAGTTIEGTPKFRLQYTPVNGQPVTYTEDQLPANIKIINDPNFTSGTHKAIQIVGSATDAYTPITGDYKLLVDVTAQGGNPFPSYASPAAAAGDDLKIQASYNLPQPTFGPRDTQVPYSPSVPKTPTGTFPVTLQGTMDEGFIGQQKTTVSLYRVLAEDPQQRPVLIGTVAPSQISGDGVNWQATVNVPIDGLYPLPYTVYAVVNDGYNAPVTTADSETFTPAFAVEGDVAVQQTSDALPGWSVFLDYNNDGFREPNEPILQTSNPDGFYASTPAFAPSTGWDPVPVNKKFDVRLIVPSSNYVPLRNPVTVIYDGVGTEDVSFNVQQKTSIQGKVYRLLPDGSKAALAGWTVLLDDGSGEQTAVTDASGNYVFFGLTPDSTATVRLQSQSGYYTTDSYTVAVGSGEFTVYDNNDFAVLPFSTVSGQLLAFGGPLQGWTVNLTQGGQVIATTTSAADGSYSFGGVEAGSYAVVEVAPLTWQSVAPANVTVVPYQNVSGVNFVNDRVLDTLVPGGGFEAPVVGNGAYQPNPGGSPWTFSATSGISGNGSALTAGNPNAPEGSQVAYLQGQGTISQTINFATAGLYTLSFQAAQRANVPGSNQAFQVEIDGTVLGTFTPAGTSYGMLGTNSFSVAAGSHVISFVGLTTSGQKGAAFIDAVTIHVLNTIADPGFETPVVGSGQYTYRPAASPWSFSGRSGVSGNDSAVTAGSPNAPEGSQVAFFQEGYGICSQTVNFAGGTYTLSLLASVLGSSGGFFGGVWFIGVSIDNQAVDLLGVRGTSYALYTTHRFTVTAGPHLVRFFLNGDEKSTLLMDAVTLQQGPVVSDAGFETPGVGGDPYGPGYQYNPSGSAWTFSGTSGISANNSGFTAGNPNAPEGRQVAFLQETGSISQAVNFSVAGTYDLSFWAAQRGNGNASSQTFDVEIDGRVVGSFTPSGTSYKVYTTSVFTVTAGVHTISFVGVDPNGGDNTAFLDAVSIQFAPGLGDTLPPPKGSRDGAGNGRRHGRPDDRAEHQARDEALGLLLAEWSRPQSRQLFTADIPNGGRRPAGDQAWDERVIDDLLFGYSQVDQSPRRTRR